MTQPDERPGFGLQGSQAMLQLLIPPHEVHSPHCDVQQALTLPQQQKSLALLLLMLQDLFPAPLLMLIGWRTAVPTAFASIFGIVAATVNTTATDTVSGNVRLLFFFP
jgi:hypothetical protein